MGGTSTSMRFRSLARLSFESVCASQESEYWPGWWISRLRAEVGRRRRGWLSPVRSGLLQAAIRRPRELRSTTLVVAGAVATIVVGIVSLWVGRKIDGPRTGSEKAPPKPQARQRR